MSRTTWVLAAIGLAGLVALLFASQAALRNVGGVEEAVELQDAFRRSHAAFFAGEPPLKVYRVPPSEESREWRWKVEATLRPGVGAGSPELARVEERMVVRLLTARAGPGAAGGVILLLHVPGGADVARRYDGQGAPLRGGGPGR
jgi:hypothetical protein